MSNPFESNFDMTKEEERALGESKFKTLEEGDNYIRILGSYIFRNIHYVPDAQIRYIICCGEGCPLCAAGNKPKLSYYVNIFDRADNKVKILRFGVTVRKALYNLYRKYGDLSQFDIIITREGTGLDTQYSIMPAPPKENMEFTPEIIEKIKKEYINLDEEFKIPTADEILSLIGSSDNNTLGDNGNVEYPTCYGTSYNPVNPDCQKCKYKEECKKKTIAQFEG